MVVSCGKWVVVVMVACGKWVVVVVGGCDGGG